MHCRWISVFSSLRKENDFDELQLHILVGVSGENNKEVLEDVADDCPVFAFNGQLLFPRNDHLCSMDGHRRDTHPCCGGGGKGDTPSLKQWARQRWEKSKLERRRKASLICVEEEESWRRGRG